MISLHGRDQALGALRELLATARAGAAVSVVIDGVRGAGKTELLNQFLREHAELPTLWAGAAQWEQHTPLGVAEQLLRTPVPEPAWRALLSRLADAGIKGGPVIVAVDNAHLADVASLQALTSALERASEGVLLLLTADPDARDPAAVLELVERHRRHCITLQPLPTGDVSALAEELIGVRLSVPVARRLAAHTGGNPGYLVRLLRENDPELWSRWIPLLPVPRAEQAAITARLGETTTQARHLIEAAAILGIVGGLGQVAALAEIDDPVAALDAACATGLVRTDATRPLAIIEFPAPLVRSAVLAAMTPLTMRQLHCRAAESAADEGVRLGHLVAAEPIADGALADRLDNYAATRAASGEWAACAAAFIKASHISPTPALRENRLIRGVDALIGAGRVPQAEEFVPEIESFGEGALRDSVLGYLAMMRGRAAEAQLLLTRAWRGCGTEPAGSVAASIAQRHVLDALTRWDGARLLRWADQVTRLTTPTTPEAIEAAAINGLGLAMTGQLEAAARTYSNDLAETVLGAQSQRFRMAKGWLALALDDLDSARLLLESAVPTAFRFGSVRISLWAQVWLARVQFALGEWDDALRTVEHGVAEAEASGLDFIRPLMHWTGAQIHALRGEDEPANQHLQLGRTNSREYLVMHIPSALAHAQYAEAHADHEGVIRALGSVARVAPDSDQAGFWPWADVYATALVMSGRAAEADRFLRRYEDDARRIGHRSSLGRLGSVRGRIAEATDGIAAAAAIFEQALREIESLPLPYERARIAFAYGQTLRRAGKRREADTMMRSARETFAALGAHTYVERCDRELKAAGVNSKRSRDPLSELTEQERAVATLVAEGKTNKQAAEGLFLSVKTIQYHLTRVYAKLRIRSRTELVSHMRDLG
ncbi:LuxR C-terminal-related transcriptional regulator [Nocardia sp. SYP-A9097]|uniref:helix-turn-helix transcriptional regulator n=1 Tax=Nocardia sp. SYP-A9097 TaxID=2663237 RepID=UPI00281562B3|nr:LuxR C-terminal-related transcriptional regulator [Nocardia sp. SYP-A9097]